LGNEFNIVGLPHTMILDENNIVLMNISGYDKKNMKRLADALQKITKSRVHFMQVHQNQLLSQSQTSKPVRLGDHHILPGCTATFQAQAKPAKDKAAQAAKEKVILMPMDITVEDRSMTSDMQNAVIQGLQQKYQVYSGEQVLTELKKAADKQNQSTKQDMRRDQMPARCFDGV
jgi:hypothetical protein